MGSSSGGLGPPGSLASQVGDSGLHGRTPMMAQSWPVRLAGQVGQGHKPYLAIQVESGRAFLFAPSE